MRSSRGDGFTLIELAITVVIIGVMAASLLPGMAATAADGRSANAAVDLVRLAGRARAEANFTGLAHVLAYDSNTVDQQQLGRVRLYRSSADTGGTIQPSYDCNAASWNFNDPVNSGALIDGLDMTSYNITKPGTGGAVTLPSSHLIRLLPVTQADYPSTAMGSVRICYQPDGRTMIRNGDSGGFTDTVVGAADVLFNVIHANKDTGAALGVPRRVVFTFGGNARIRR